MASSLRALSRHARKWGTNPGADRTCRQYCLESPFAGYASSSHNRERGLIKDRLEEGHRRYLIAPMAPALTSPDHQEVEPQLFGLSGVVGVADLGRDQCSAFSEGGKKALVGAITDRDQSRLCCHDGIDQLRALVDRPGQQADTPGASKLL